MQRVRTHRQTDRGTPSVLKWCLLAGMGLSAVILAQSTVQWVTIMRGFADPERSPDSLGYFYIPTPNTYWSGQLFEAYRELSGDTLSRFVRLRQWTDSFVHHHHYEYQHYFMDIPVVGGIVREHFSDEGLYLLHGKIGWFDGIDTIDWRKLLDPQLAVSMFLQAHFKYPDDTTYYFAWEDSLWEAYLKSELEDSTATWFPTARLVWISPNIGNSSGSYLTNLHLAYAIRVVCIDPFFDTTYYVDAFAPWNVIVAISNVYSVGVNNPCPSGYGLASVWYHGNRCIDTRKQGNKYILRADDDDHDFSTKYYAMLLPCALIANIKDKDNDWVGVHGDATSVHWFVQQAWDFFHWQMNHLLARRICIKVNMPQPDASAGQALWGYYSMYVGNVPDFHATRALDVIAHEFAHLVIRETSNLTYIGESGALNESFSDIMGVTVEHWVEGPSADWLLMEDGSTNPMVIRSLQAPKQYGYHYDTSGNVHLGQPDTYKGLFWDNGGAVHVNSGPANHWFYLLSAGGSGINDHGASYQVSGIGVFTAADIVFKAWTNYMVSASGYYDAAQATLTAQQVLYGSCFYQEQIWNAWHAVGLDTNLLSRQPCTMTGLGGHLLQDGVVKGYWVNANQKVLISVPLMSYYELLSSTGVVLQQGYTLQPFIAFRLPVSGVYWLRLNGQEIIQIIVQ